MSEAVKSILKEQIDKHGNSDSDQRNRIYDASRRAVQRLPLTAREEKALEIEQAIEAIEQDFQREERNDDLVNDESDETRPHVRRHRESGKGNRKRPSPRMLLGIAVAVLGLFYFSVLYLTAPERSTNSDARQAGQQGALTEVLIDLEFADDMDLVSSGSPVGNSGNAPRQVSRENGLIISEETTLTIDHLIEVDPSASYIGMLSLVFERGLPKSISAGFVNFDTIEVDQDTTPLGIRNFIHNGRIRSRHVDPLTEEVTLSGVISGESDRSRDAFVAGTKAARPIISIIPGADGQKVILKSLHLMRVD